MFRQLVLLTFLVATIAGCNKKKDDGSGGVENSGDPNAEYTIKLREPQVGEKYQILRTGNTVTTATRTVKGQPKSDETRTSSRFEYTDEIIESKDPKDRPTKAKHVYSAAERVINGKTVPASFQGKTVLIDRSGTGYTFRIEKGGKLSPEDVKYFARQYNTKPRKRPQDLIPNRAVRVGETWQVDKEAMAKQFKEDGLVLEDSKTTGVGKLTKVYQKDGKQFGVIELRFEVYPLESNDAGRKTTMKPGSKIVYELRADTCIDGTTSESAVTNRSLGELIVIQGGEVKLSIDETDTVTGKLIQ